MVYLLVIGSPSLDRLHFTSTSQASAGGVGMNTALAAWQSFNLSDWNAARQLQSDFFRSNPSKK